ncbi:MAG: rhomboid family intramembrane serine protease, partial [Deltaproteobacteria bacterium]|nr:rhomboid family intramembrane serine protease [Deltaproteobacteria bacterium]
MTDPSASLLCPRCRRLVSRGETRCPYCGLPHPAGLHLLGALVRWLSRPEDFVRGLIWLNVIVFGLSLLLNPGGVRLSANPLRFLSPNTESLILLGASGTFPIERLGRWWSLLTAGYLHGGLLHIFFNMAALNQLAPLIARQFGIFRMFTIYTLGAAAGFYASYLAGVALTIGASAGLCALIGAAIYYGKRRGGIYGRVVFRQTSGWIVGLVLIGLLPGINNWAHGGGLLAGAVLAFLVGYSERRPESFWHVVTGGILMVATVLALGWAVA